MWAAPWHFESHTVTGFATARITHVYYIPASNDNYVCWSRPSLKVTKNWRWYNALRPTVAVAPMVAPCDTFAAPHWRVSGLLDRASARRHKRRRWQQRL